MFLPPHWRTVPNSLGAHTTYTTTYTYLPSSHPPTLMRLWANDSTLVRGNAQMSCHTSMLVASPFEKDPSLSGTHLCVDERIDLSLSPPTPPSL